MVMYIFSTAVVYLCIIAVQHFLNGPHSKINTSNLPVPVPFSMRGNNSRNTSSLACNRSVQKASKVRKNGQIFGPKMFVLPLYLHNAAPSTPIKCGSKGPAYKMRKKKQKKRERKRGRKEEKIWDQIAKKPKNIHVCIHFPTVTPVP